MEKHFNLSLCEVFGHVKHFTLISVMKSGLLRRPQFSSKLAIRRYTILNTI